MYHRLGRVFLVDCLLTTKVPDGVTWALIVFGAAVVQAALGIFSHSLSQLSILHGINALILFGAAVTAGMRVTRARGPIEARQAESVPANA